MEALGLFRFISSDYETATNEKKGQIARLVPSGRIPLEIIKPLHRGFQAGGGIFGVLVATEIRARKKEDRSPP